MLSLMKIFPFLSRRKDFVRNEALNTIKQCCSEVKEEMDEKIRYSIGGDNYETAEEALRRSIAFSGRPQKDIASILWPRDKIDAAKTRLSRALSQENTDVSLSLKQVLSIMNETRPDDFINYLCDEFGFERPRKRSADDLHKAVEEGMRDLNSKITFLLKQVSLLGDGKGK